ncbi:ABC transporter substrate-binding protein [Streptomyces violaceusniger]|uniref:ABC transporter substrate-binding protein n=1 Tax=Streptomyces violaceusniger TaxID=68280 RepID=UPI0009977D0E|nr:ABC transporter substrate-binding protein [Streptomyces hygroscopicus]AQW46914.1 ABC transporter substrate-binding protein [Streptomyces hygroscopicus]
MRDPRRLAAVVIAPLLLAGCGPSGAGSRTSASGTSLTWGVTTEPQCFDPHRSTQQNAFIIIRNYVDSLISKKPDGTFAPWLATRWKISKGGTVYTFRLRDDVTFSDGTRFDAKAAKANLDYVADPANAADAASLLVNYQRGTTPDPHTLRVELKKPDSSLLESFSSVKLGFLSPAALKKGDTLCDASPSLVGTGPFTIDGYTRGQSVRFRKNPRYDWPPGYSEHRGPAYLNTVTYRFLPEYSTRAGALSSGQVDAIEGVQPLDVPLFEDAKGFQYRTGPSRQTSFTLNVNYTRGPGADIRVRRALRDGADLDAVVKAVYRGTVSRAWSNIGPDNSDYDASLKGSWGNDPEKANRLLDEAGWTGRDSDGYRTKRGKRLTLEVGYPQPYVRDNRDVLIEALQAELRQNIGLDLDLKINTAGEFTDQKAHGTWTVYPNTLNPLDAGMELRQVLGSTEFLYGNVRGYDRKLDGMIHRALATTDLDKRRPLLARIQRRAVDRAYIVPLFAPHYQIAATDKVHGLGFETQLDSPANNYAIRVGR